MSTEPPRRKPTGDELLRKLPGYDPEGGTLVQPSPRKDVTITTGYKDDPPGETPEERERRLWAFGIEE